MQSARELDEFRTWYQCSEKDDRLARHRAYGRLVLTDARGRRRKRRYKIGVALVTTDGVAFLRKVRPIPLWAIAFGVPGFIAILALSMYIEFHTGRTPFFLILVPTIGVYFGAQWLYRRAPDLSNPSTLARSAEDPLSAFVPLTRIAAVDMVKPFGLANPYHLRIHFRNDAGPENELILGDMAAGRVGFDAELVRQRIAGALSRR